MLNVLFWFDGVLIEFFCLSCGANNQFLVCMYDEFCALRTSLQGRTVLNNLTASALPRSSLNNGIAIGAVNCYFAVHSSCHRFNWRRSDAVISHYYYLHDSYRSDVVELVA